MTQQSHGHGHAHEHGHAGHGDRFSQKAATWDDEPGNLPRAQAVAQLIRDTVPLRPDLSTLEIGGGTGLLSRQLAGDLGPVLLTDVAPGMVDAAAAAVEREALQGWRAQLFDIEHDDVPDQRFDLVLGLLTLHHMGDVAAVLRRTAELLRPGGYVVFADLDHDPHGDFHAAVHDFDGHNGFTRESVQQWLQDAGFVEVTISDAGVVDKEVDGERRSFPMFLAVGRIS